MQVDHSRGERKSVSSPDRLPSRSFYPIPPGHKCVSYAPSMSERVSVFPSAMMTVSAHNDVGVGAALSTSSSAKTVGHLSFRFQYVFSLHGMTPIHAPCLPQSKSSSSVTTRACSPFDRHLAPRSALKPMHSF